MIPAKAAQRGGDDQCQDSLLPSKCPLDDSRFDNALRALTASPSRRTVLPALAAEVFDSGFAASFEEVEARTCGECKKKGGRCKKAEDGT